MRLVKGLFRPTRLVSLAILLVTVVLVQGIIARRNAARSADHFEQGRRALEQGDTDTALAEFDEAVRLNPRALKPRRERIPLLIERLRWDEAVADCTEVLRRTPGDAELYVLRAEAYVGRGRGRDRPEDLDRALADADAALRLDPGQALAYCQRTLAHAAKFDDSRALADANEAAHLRPQDARVYLTRGRDRAARGEDGQAVADFTEALRLDPQLARAYALRGLSRFELQDPGAEADFQRAVDLAPQDAWVYCYRALAYRKDKRSAKALADLDRALELAPRDVTSYVQRAGCHAERHDVRRALADCETALGINPSSSLALAVRALCQLGRGRKDKSRADMKEAIRLRPDSPFVRLLSAGLYRAEDKPAETIAEYDRILTTGNARMARLLYPRRATCFLQRGEFDRAIADCTRVLELDPKSIEAYAIRSVAHHRKGAADQGRPDFAEAVRLDRKKAYQGRAEAYTVLKAFHEASVDWTEVIRLTPREAEPYLMRALAYVEQPTRAAEAIADCRQALELAPEDALAHRILAAAYGLLKRHDEAIKSATEVLRLDSEDPLAFLARAQAHLQRNENDKAIADATEALRLGTEGGTAYAIRGLAHGNRRDHDQARADLAEAARHDPKFVELKTAYERRVAADKALFPGGLNPHLFDVPSLKGSFEKPAGEPFHWPRGPALLIALAAASVAFLLAVVAGYLKGKTR